MSKVRVRQIEQDVHLFISRKKCKRFLRKIGWNDVKLMDTDAQTISGDVDGRTVSVVLMDQCGDAREEVALLAHEAYHAALYVAKKIGASEEEELMAYLVQNTLYDLMAEYDKLLKKHG